MADQGAVGEGPSVPVLYSHYQQTVRLLELPAEILDLVTSETPQILFFKSAPVHPGPVNAAAPAHASLCTESKSYGVRQVQTSNSVFLTQPMLSPDGGAPGVCAIATCASTLEVTPLEPNPELLISLLQTYDIDDPPVAPMSGRGKLDVFADVPYSHGECEIVWSAHSAFSMDGCSFKPTSATLLKLWNSVLVTSASLGIDVTVPAFDHEQVWPGVEEVGFPKPLYDAVIAWLSGGPSHADSAWRQLDKDRCIPWVGRQLAVAGTLNKNDLHTSHFIEIWRSAVPEPWAEDINLATYEALSATLSDNVKGEPNGGLLSKIQDASLQKKKATSSAPGKRDWHEKFKASRRSTPQNS